MFFNTSTETEIQGNITDGHYDFYGRRMALATSNGTIHIFDILNDNSSKTNEINGHEGPVNQISWAHPRFGNVIASCGMDRKIILWRETQNKWEKIYEYLEHDNSTTCITFAPHNLGCIFISGSLDGFISIHEYKAEQWHTSKYFSHYLGVNSLTWAPCREGEEFLQFASCGRDGQIKLWHGEDASSLSITSSIDAHEDSVTDVQFRSLNSNFIASAGEDRNLFLWTLGQNSEWNKIHLGQFNSRIEKIAWDETGNSLAVAESEGFVYMFKEGEDGNWNIVSQTNSEGVITN